MCVGTATIMSLAQIHERRTQSSLPGMWHMPYSSHGRRGRYAAYAVYQPHSLWRLYGICRILTTVAAVSIRHMPYTSHSRCGRYAASAVTILRVSSVLDSRTVCDLCALRLFRLDLNALPHRTIVDVFALVDRHPVACGYTQCRRTVTRAITCW